VVDASSSVEELSARLSQDHPDLQEGYLPATGLLKAPVKDPDLYPDDVPKRGYLVPAAGADRRKLLHQDFPRFVGVDRGRPWRVDLLFTPRGRVPFPPTIMIRTSVRLLPADVVYPVPIPWAFAVPRDVVSLAGASFAGDRNLVGMVGLRTAKAAAVRLGTRIENLPTGGDSTYVGSSDPRVQAWLGSPEFNSLYGAWKSRSGSSLGAGGSRAPALGIEADRLTLLYGLKEGVPALEHSKTVSEAVQLADAIEAAAGVDPARSPMPTLTFSEPLGSLPDVRYAYECPRCHRQELLHRSFDQSAHRRLWRSLDCGAEIFLPETTA
jgi:hypothetical protein